MECDFTPYQMEILLLLKDVALLFSGIALFYFSIRWLTLGKKALDGKDRLVATSLLRKSLAACILSAPALLLGFISLMDVGAVPEGFPMGAALMTVSKIARIVTGIGVLLLEFFLFLFIVSNFWEISLCDKMDDTKKG